ncbi:hybrid sensor histidine kinase/response regulator [Desulfogranum mediterraneum]|uniref:hybrid sensor histidine kinase/response regulator n=1 Tax=Desulfogranum mediterraneum TaxID=160661 RepID=UPI00040C8A3F|nr:PAS domain-containing protein [Desulfogranum mediterraneum]
MGGESVGRGAGEPGAWSGTVGSGGAPRFFRQLLDELPDPVFVKDRDHCWLYLNPALCRLVGHRAEEMLGKSDYDFFPKEQADVFWEMDELVYTSGTAHTNVEQIQDAQGNTRTISTRKSLIRDDQGRSLLYGVISDVSEVHSLRHHEVQMNRVLKRLALGDSLEQILAMIIEIAEAEFAGMIASILRVDESGKRLVQVVPSRLPDSFQQAINRTPIREAMGACGTAAYRRQRVVSVDLEHHPFWQGVVLEVRKAGLQSCWSEPIIASNGVVVGTFALYYRALREPEAAETRLMETMAQLAAVAMEHHQMNQEALRLRRMLGNVVDSMPSVLIGVNPAGQVSQWNKEAEKVTGILQQDALGRDLASVYPHIKEEVMVEVRRAIHTRQVQPTLKNSRQAGADTLYEDITIYPLAANGTEGAVIRIDDVSERVRLEEAMIQTDKLMSIGVLAGGIAHDFNNILVGILANLGLLSHALAPDCSEHELVARTEGAALRARGLANQLLTFAKGGVPHCRAMDLAELVTGSVQFALTGSDVRCVYRFGEDLWPVSVDGDQIGQVMQNLVINAKQAMAPGGQITISCVNVERASVSLPPLLGGERYVKVQVRDNGPGIPAAVIKHIFDPYFSTKQDGNGLGLAVCHSIVSRHQGVLNVEQAPGGGALFTFYLPVAEEAELPQASQEETPRGSGTILVMDDEQIVLDALASILDFLGYDVLLAREGAEALRIYEQARKGGKPPDLVIMDLTIPSGMGGKEAVQRLLSLSADARVVVTSGYSHDPILAKYRDYGFAAALSKPFRLAEVATVVHRLLNQGEEPGKDH